MNRGFAGIILMLISLLVLSILFVMFYLPTLTSLAPGSPGSQSIITPIERARDIKSKIESRNNQNCPLGSCEPGQ